MKKDLFDEARLADERRLAEQGRAPRIYIGRPMVNLLETVIGEIRNGKLKVERAYVGWDRHGRPYVEVIGE